MKTPRPPRLFRPTPADRFPAADIVAVHDQVENVVLFNVTFSGEDRLERQAMFMDQIGDAPVLRLPADYVFKVT